MDRGALMRKVEAAWRGWRRRGGALQQLAYERKRRYREGEVASSHGMWAVEKVLEVEETERRHASGPAPKRAKVRWVGRHAGLGRWVDSWVAWPQLNAALKREARAVWEAGATGRKRASPEAAGSGGKRKSPRLAGAGGTQGSDEPGVT